MFSIVTRAARLAGAHWPALLAWFLAGWLARYVLIELAALVGSSWLLGGLLIMPLAILARLISFVAMFLVLRPSMPQLQRLAASPASAKARRTEFMNAVMVAILPFFAFYAAWGFLRDDMHQYSRGAIDNFTAQHAFTDGASFTEIDQLHFDALTISIIVLYFAGRWALGRFASRLPRWTALVGVYLEAIWVFMTVYLISGVLASITTWFDTRQAMVWLDDMRGWLSEFASPLIWVWDAAAWAVGEVGGLVLLPLAWLTIAGVIYGHALPARRIAAPASLSAARQRYETVAPGWLRRRLGDLGMQFVRRFRPVWRAMLTIWHAGAIPMGVYILVYTIIAALQGWITWGLVAVIGPHDLQTFWMIIDALLAFVVMLVIEPVRVALVAAAYDHAVGSAEAPVSETARMQMDAAAPPATTALATPALAAPAGETAEAPAPPRSPD